MGRVSLRMVEIEVVESGNQLKIPVVDVRARIASFPAYR